MPSLVRVDAAGDDTLDAASGAAADTAVKGAGGNVGLYAAPAPTEDAGAD